MPYLCLRCGSLRWVEQQVVNAVYEADFEYGNGDEEIDREITEVEHIYCAECDSTELLYFSINETLDKNEFTSIAKKICKLDNEERIKYILLILLEDWDKEEPRIIDENDFFIDKKDLIEYLKDLGVSEDELILASV